MRGLMVCGEFPDIRCGRITHALSQRGYPHGVTTLRIPPQFDDVYEFVDWDNMDCAWGIAERAVTHDADIYHVHGELHQFWPVPYLKELTKKPVILNVHDLVSARPKSVLDVYEEEGMAKADALVFVTEEQRAFAKGMGLPIAKPYCIVPNHVSRRSFVREKILPHIGGVVVHGGTAARGDGSNSIDYSRISDTLGGALHIYSGNDAPDYGIVHEMQLEHDVLMHQLARHDWGFAGTATLDAVWGQALPTKVGEYFAAGIPVIALNCPPVKPLCDLGMGIYLDDVRDLPEAASTDPAPYIYQVLKHRAEFTTENFIEPLIQLYEELA